MKIDILAIGLLAMLAGCGETDPNAAGSQEPVPAPEVDADPTPQTGTGGQQQGATPEAPADNAPAN
jgi:hypothetical protein